MAETLGIVTDFSSVAQDIIVVWYKNSNPTAEVDRLVKEAAHAASDVITIENLDTVTYIFKFYETADGVTFGTLLSSWSIQVKGSQETVTPYEYVVGGTGGEDGIWSDPPIDGTQINDTRLQGADRLIVFSSVGLRQTWEYSVLPAGGIQLEIAGDVFAKDEKWTILAIRKVQSSGSTSSSGGGIGGIKKVSADGDFDNTYYSKKIIADFSSTIGTTSFPAFATIPNETKARFSTFTGSQRYWKLAFGAGDSIRVNGKDYNIFYLAKDEVIELEWLDGICYAEYKGRIQLTGNYILTNNKNMIGTASCDGDGTEFNISDYQRLIDELPAELKVSYTDWVLTTNVTVGEITKSYQKNKAKFAIDAVNGKFKFPDLRGQSLRVLLKTDGTTDTARLTQGAAGMQAQEIISHTHTTGDKTGLSDNANDRNVMLPDGSGTGKTGATGGTEQRIDNIGQYALVYL